MANSYLLTTSNPLLGSTPLPTDAVGQYVNQQIIGNQNRSIESLQNAYQPGGAITNRESPQVSGQSSVSVQQPAAFKSVSEVAASNDRQSQDAFYRAIAARNKRAASTAGNTAGTSGGSYGSNTYTVPAGVTGNRAAALSKAKGYLGSPYVLGGTSTSGIDCSGLVMMVYGSLGYNIPRHSATWQRDNIPGVRTNDINSLRPGDLVAWKDGSHIAIYAGNGNIIESANERVGTVYRKLWTSTSNVIGIKLRFAGE